MDKNHITAIVLAGGRGSRMGGVDKGLQIFRGVPLMQHALQRITPQVHHVILNANRNLTTYRSWDVEVFPDDDSDFSGPLSGFIAGLAHCKTPYLLTIPCDTPFFPFDLASRLLAALQSHDAEIAMAAQAGYAQPVFCLLKKDLLPNLLRFMKNGGRKVGAWTATQKITLVNFDAPADNPQAFANANTMSELSALEQLNADMPKPTRV